MNSRRRVLTLGVGLILPAIGTHSVFGRSGFAPPAELGRVNRTGWFVRSSPSFRGKVLNTPRFDQVIALKGEVIGDAFGAHKNRTWYETDGGFIHSAQVQPVRNFPQIAEDLMTARKRFLGEVSVPLTDVRATAGTKGKLNKRLYYGCTMRIDNLVTAADGSAWYRIAGGVIGGGYVNAAHIRRVHLGEVAPIAPEIENKRVHVDMVKSVVTAYEGNAEVFAVACATGSRKNNAFTPAGNWPVLYKAASYHMQGDPKRGHTNWDYPAVPWVTYFSATTGASLHGTYWHNDWGGWRSAGCVNLNNDAARWFYRWTNPGPPYDGGFWPTPDVSKATVISVQY
jgi:hypothetical protein